MADAKITQLNELVATPDNADLVAIVDDPAGSPETKKITYANLGIPANTTHRSSDGSDHTFINQNVTTTGTPTFGDTTVANAGATQTDLNIQNATNTWTLSNEADGDFTIYNSNANGIILDDNIGDSNLGDILVATDATVTINPDGVNRDTIIEGDTDANLLNVDAGEDKVGIGKVPSLAKLDVSGTVAIGNGIVNDGLINTFTNLSTTPQNINGGATLGKSRMAIGLTNIDGDVGTMDIWSGIEAGVGFKYTGYAYGNCAVAESPEGTFAITGLGDGRTYTITFNTGNGTATLKASTTATGTTTLRMHRTILG